MYLSKAKTGDSCVITGTTATGTALARLDSLGLVNGEVLHVLQASYAGLIVNVKGSRLAICKSMADTLEVERQAVAED